MFYRTLEKTMSYNGHLLDYQKYVLQRYAFVNGSRKISLFSTAVINTDTSGSLISNASCSEAKLSKAMPSSDPKGSSERGTFEITKGNSERVAFDWEKYSVGYFQYPTGLLRNPVFPFETYSFEGSFTSECGAFETCLLFSIFE